MATKSILKDVIIKDRRLAGSFVDALESAGSTPYRGPEKKLNIKEASKEKVEELFGGYGITSRDK